MTKNVDHMGKYLNSRPKINGLKSAIAVHGLFSMVTQKCLCHHIVCHFFWGGRGSNINWKKIRFQLFGCKVSVIF